jgi:hypothetical protein
MMSSWPTLKHGAGLRANSRRKPLEWQVGSLLPLPLEKNRLTRAVTHRQSYRRSRLGIQGHLNSQPRAMMDHRWVVTVVQSNRLMRANNQKNRFLMNERWLNH